MLMGVGDTVVCVCHLCDQGSSDYLKVCPSFEDYSSYEKCQYRPSGRNRICGSATPVDRSSQLSYRVYQGRSDRRGVGFFCLYVP
jgi:hypothetical protein